MESDCETVVLISSSDEFRPVWRDRCPYVRRSFGPTFSFGSSLRGCGFRFSKPANVTWRGRFLTISRTSLGLSANAATTLRRSQPTLHHHT